MKYNARKTTVYGIKFDSKAEAEYYQYLQSQTYYQIIELQPKVYLTDAKILYKPDFLLMDDSDKLFFVDVKGMETPVFRIKKRLWKAYRSEELHIVKKKGKYFHTTDIVNGS